MPFGPYTNFDDCLTKQMSKGRSKLSAQKICGSLQSKLGGGNFESYDITPAGELYLKYFLADDTVARKVRLPDGTPIESPYDFNLASDAIGTRDDELIGLPLSVLPTKELSIFGDFHPWSPKPNATWDDHVAFARNYSPGSIVAVTPNSNLVSGAVDEIKQHNGKFVVVHVSNHDARDAYIKNPEIIPKAVSPGLMNHDAPNVRDIRNFRWAHLAAVPSGAYGSKATLYGSCIGNEGCINQLVAGAVLNLAERTTYCPVGASIMLTSLVSNNATNHKMEGSNSTASTGTSGQSNTTSAQGVSAIGLTQPRPGVIRLKKQLMQNTNPNPSPLGQMQGFGYGQEEGIDPSRKELDAVKVQLAEIQKQNEQNQRREQIKKQIPKELFIMKGKFDEKGFESEVEKRLALNWDDSTIAEFYNSKMELLKYGFQFPKEGLEGQQTLNQNPTPEAPGLQQMGAATPTGGSAVYTTPSSVPELTGGSTIENYIQENVRQLLSRCMRRPE